MNIKRYNQILVAVLGTAGLLGAMGILLLIAVEYVREDREPRIVLEESANGEVDEIEQDLMFCSPTFVHGSAMQLIPVAVRSRNEDGEVRLRSGGLARSAAYSKGSYYRGGCHLSQHMKSSQIFNVIARGAGTSSQRLLFTKPTQLAEFHMPHEACAERVGGLPCDMLLWLVRDRDSNGDGAIDDSDGLVAYHSDLKATALHAATPQEVSVVSFTWDTERNSLLYLVRIDQSGDGSFDEDDPTELLEFVIGTSAIASDFVAPAIRASLEEKLR